MARAAAKQKMMWEALKEAIDEEMEKDPNVCVIGAFTLNCRLLGPEPIVRTSDNFVQKSATLMTLQNGALTV